MKKKMFHMDVVHCIQGHSIYIALSQLGLNSVVELENCMPMLARWHFIETVTMPVVVVIGQMFCDHITFSSIEVAVIIASTNCTLL